MKKNGLNIISLDEIEEKIKNHLLWLRGNGEIKDRDFSNIDFSNLDSYYFRSFVGVNLSKSNFQKSNLTGKNFNNSDLTEANFQKTNLTGVSFSSSKLTGTDFRGAIFFPKQFSESQNKDLILTDEDYKNYQERKKLEEENKKLKKEVKQKNETIETIGEKQTDKLIEGFENLLNEFKLEEKRWLFIGGLAFFCILITTSIPILDDFFYKYIYKIIFISILIIFFLLFLPVVTILNTQNKEKQKFNIEFKILTLYNELKKIKIEIIINYIINLFTNFINFLISLSIILCIFYITYKIPLANSSIFQISPKFGLIPLGFILFSLLYFSLYQYSKAKQLRIENQNKIAILHGFQALRAEKGDGVEKGRFYDNISNVVFTKVYNKKTSNDLPVDKLLELTINNLLKK